MSRPKCPNCSSPNVIRKGIRRGAVKYYCLECGKWFQVLHSHGPNKAQILLEHLDGRSFRSLALQYGISAYTAHAWCHEELKKLPACIDITRKYCTRFCGRILVDGKYLKVKGYERKIPVIYGIDYTTHDIPHYLLAPDEGYKPCLKLFSSLRLANYQLYGLTSDDNRNIYEACKFIFPQAVTQLCLNHYKENIRQLLGVRLEETPQTHKIFMKALEHLFAKKRSLQELEIIAGKMVTAFGRDPKLLPVLLDLQKRQHLIFAYQFLKNIPTTTNLIESFNSHLQGRLETIKGFESFEHADLWLNGYFLRRRTKIFTDCSTHFKRLNGKTSLSQSQNRDIDVPTFF